MSIMKTLGGDRLGSGKKMKVELHGFERSTHNLSKIWRSTMSAGTLVPFLKELALPGDSFDIDLECDIKTHPTIGPLFGSYKVQLDIFQAPIELYQALLHNNALEIGLNMSQVKLPQMTLQADPDVPFDESDPDNSQIDPSCILSYLDIRGVGRITSAPGTGKVNRQFNAIPYLMYVDVFKNYYANKQEDLAYVIHTEIATPVNAITLVQFWDWSASAAATIPQFPTTASNIISGWVDASFSITTSALQPLDQLKFNTNKGVMFASDVLILQSQTSALITAEWNFAKTGVVEILNWDYVDVSEIAPKPPVLFDFPLKDIDRMRNYILSDVFTTSAFDVSSFAEDNNIYPYKYLLGKTPDKTMQYRYSQEGLLVKTYQSDLFNNWMNTDWIDGPSGINTITAVSTAGGSFTVDSLALARKTRDMLNRIAVSGGSYDDWQDAVYAHERYRRCSTPIYHGSLIRELVFQEVVSNSESNSNDGQQPLGTLAGKGVMGKKKKGGRINVRVDVPSYILGIISITPRVDYSQGNKWDTHLETMDDLHKPSMDQIGFQELITEQMAWWSTEQVPGDDWLTRSAGKQPSWINYMTNVNEVRGNFAFKDNEMFMVLNRRYEYDAGGGNILDLTTYIDPVKFNFIFANTAIDAQNFWAQIGCDMTVRRKMSAKVIPNL